jgi:hypothetical protein
MVIRQNTLGQNPGIASVRPHTNLPSCQAIHARTDGRFLDDPLLARVLFSIRDDRTVETA